MYVCVCDLKFQNLLVRQRTFPWLCDYLVLFFPELIEMLYLVYYPWRVLKLCIIISDHRAELYKDKQRDDKTQEVV